MVKLRFSEYEILPADTYLAKVVDITEETGQYGPQLRYRYRIIEGEFKGRELTGWTSQKTGPKSRLRQLVRAVTKTEIPPNYILDTEALLQRELYIIVTIGNGLNGTQYNRIEGFLPSSKTRPVGEA